MNFCRHTSHAIICMCLYDSFECASLCTLHMDYYDELFYTVCPVGSYSDGVSNDLCESCPTNSEATETGLAECPCIQNYYRATDEKADLPCASEFF